MDRRDSAVRHRAVPRGAARHATRSLACVRTLPGECDSAGPHHRRGALSDGVVLAGRIQVGGANHLRFSRAHDFLITHPEFLSAISASAWLAPASACTMRMARSRNFTFAGTTSTIRLLITLPMRTIASVVTRFRDRK